MKQLFLLLLVLLPSFAFAQVDKAEKIYDEGYACVKSHRFQEAKATWMKLLELKDIPDDKMAKYYCDLGLLCKDSIYDKDAATVFFKKSAEYLPSVVAPKASQKDSVDFSAVSSCLCLSALADTIKNYDEMLEYALKGHDGIVALQENKVPVKDFEPNDLVSALPVFTMNVANAYSNLLRYDEAEKWFAKATKDCEEMTKDPASEDYAGGHAYLFMVDYARNAMYSSKKKDYAASRDVSLSLVKKVEDYSKSSHEGVRYVAATYGVMAYFSVADAYRHLDEFQKGIEYCDKALMAPSNSDAFIPFVLDIRGECYLALGNEAEAKACWQMVKDRVPSYYDIETPKDNDNKWALWKKFGKK